MAFGTVFKGLAKFIKALKVFEGNAEDTIKDAGSIAAEMTVERAKPEVPVSTGKAADSLRVEMMGKGAVAIGGDDDTPYYAWLEYGGVAGHIFREVVPDGRYLYPASLLVERELSDQLDKGLEDAARESGLDPD